MSWPSGVATLLQPYDLVLCWCGFRIVVVLTSPMRAWMGVVAAGVSQIRKEACWTVSNIAAGNCAQIQALIDGGVMSMVINLLRVRSWVRRHPRVHRTSLLNCLLHLSFVQPLWLGSQIDTLQVRKEALWTVTNLTEDGSHEQIATVVEQGAIQALAGILASDDGNLVPVALGGLKDILMVETARAPDAVVWPWRDMLVECGGVGRLESLRVHASEAVQRSAVSRVWQPRRATVRALASLPQRSRGCGATASAPGESRACGRTLRWLLWGACSCTSYKCISTPRTKLPSTAPQVRVTR